jgi:hypothetical protein
VGEGEGERERDRDIFLNIPFKDFFQGEKRDGEINKSRTWAILFNNTGDSETNQTSAPDPIIFLGSIEWQSSCEGQ